MVASKNSDIIKEPPTFTISNAQMQDAAERRENLWVSMGIHRSDDRNSIRKRRRSKLCDSIELKNDELFENMENLGSFKRVCCEKK